MESFEEFLSSVGIKGIHPECAAVPKISKKDLAEMERDISVTGLKHPVLVSHDGLLVDGRNRLQVCFAKKIKPAMKKLGSDVDVKALVRSLNLSRRHLTAGQKAAFAVEDVKKLRAKKKASRSKNLRNAKPAETPADQEQIQGRSVEIAASIAGVSPKSVERAAAVESADPELLEKVKTGEVSLNAAYAAVQASSSSGSTESENKGGKKTDAPKPKPKTLP